MQPSTAAKAISRIFLTFLASATLAAPVHAQTFTVLHTFTGAPGDGEGPFGQLIRDSAGNLYGTTTEGGSGKCGNYGGCGTAFMLNETGKEVAKFSFNGRDGFSLLAGLLRDAAGNFYGTTVYGGDTSCFEIGCGTVFKISKTGKEAVLHKFTGSPDGEMPEALLVEDAAGNLYGTTYQGGAFENAGTVFKVDSEGNEIVLYSFCAEVNCTDGNTPYPGVIRDAAGNLYGVTAAGGEFDRGVVFQLDATGKESVLYSFSGGSDGGFPDSVLVEDAGGNLYGTTKDGGNSGCTGGAGCGVVFELSPQPGGSWTESVLYVFCSLANCADGEEPLAGPLVRDFSGNLYGTTYFGGIDDDGVVFKLDTAGKETVLHSFTGGADGADPWAGLTMDSAGNLYGVATAGGDTACFPPSGCGVVFKITP
jgi:uncharacterized repeat protein (TIGR03803 family)